MQNFKNFVIKNKGAIISVAAVSVLLLFGLFLDFAKPKSNTDSSINQSEIESSAPFQSEVESVGEKEKQ